MDSWFIWPKVWLHGIRQWASAPGALGGSMRRKLSALIVVLFACSVFLQFRIDPFVRELQKGQQTKSAMFKGLSTEFILGPMLGVGQAVAGLLWVRGDEFFHEGDYDAILPIVRMVTWLDPHQLDVYITGAWHLAYNFTDSNERSDRRYIPAAQALLREGDQNNSQLWDCAFELGWQNADKVKNYEEAEKWFARASTLKASDAAYRATLDAPMFVMHQLAHTQCREGRFTESIATWKAVLAKSEAKVKATPKDYSLLQVRDSEKHNLELTLLRHYSRYVHEIDYAVNKQQTRSVNMETGEPTPANAYLATRSSDGVPIGTPRLPATARKWNTAFDVRLEFIEPKVMEPKGQFACGDGGRVAIRLHDENWTEKQYREFTFDIDSRQTIMIDQHSVRRYKWGRKIDMSKDPKMYSFSAERFFIVFEFNPRTTSPFIQDRFGWSGEGITDPKYLLHLKSTRPGTPDLNMIRKVYLVTRAQVLASEPITEANVISNDEYLRLQAERAPKAAAPSGVQ